MALKPKQIQALELLTNGLGMSYADIAREVGITYKTLWTWKNKNPEFMAELKTRNDQRMERCLDAAIEAAGSLCREGNTSMVKFILQNNGYNPTQKIQNEVSLNDIQITISSDEKE